MAKIRNVSGEPRIVPWLGDRLVDDDEVVEIPDQWLENFACQPQVWRVEDEPKTAKRNVKDGD